jgi:hypothetical protein
VLSVHHRLVGDKAKGWRQLVDRFRLGTGFDRRGFQFFFNSGNLVAGLSSFFSVDRPNRQSGSSTWFALS